MKHIKLAVALLLGATGIAIAQGAWTVPASTNGKVRIWSTAADALCVGARGIAPPAASCAGGVYAGPILATTVSATTVTSTRGAYGVRGFDMTVFADQNNFNPGGTGTELSVSGEMRITMACNVSLCTISGIQAGQNGQRVTFVNTSVAVPPYRIFSFLHQSALSTAGNKLQNFVTVGPTIIQQGGTVTYSYDSVLAAWRLIAHEQGGWNDISHPDAVTAGMFTANTGTWTVDIGDLQVLRYRVEGTKLLVQADIVTSTLSVNLAYPQLVLPNGYAQLGASSSSTYVRTVDGTVQAGMVIPVPNLLQFRKDLAGAGFTNAANAVGLATTVTIPIQ